jgi:hypothetical protein
MIQDLLLIVQEQLKPNGEEAYDRIERELAMASAHLGCPNPYLALESVTGVKAVWWLNSFVSDADQQRVMQAYEQNTALMAELVRLAQPKAALTEPPVTILTRWRDDLSRGGAWSITGARFVVIAVTNDDGESDGSVFESPDGRRFMFTPSATRDEADRLAASVGSGARVFAVRPAWSFPTEAWVAADPQFWRPPER